MSCDPWAETLGLHKVFFAKPLRFTRGFVSHGLLGASFGLFCAAMAFPALAAGLNGKAVIDIDDPEACASCHANVVSEWRQSMHSRAHQDNDPIFGHMRQTRMAKQGEHIAKECALCHNPRSPSNTETAAAKAGVSCSSCHNLKTVHVGQGLRGAKALEFRADDQLASGRSLPADSSPAHPTGQGIDALADGQTVCMACHDAMATSSGAPTCTTGPEFRARADADETCVSCHMPLTNGPVGIFGRQEQHTSHVFAGPHRAWYQNDSTILQQALDLTASWQTNGFEVTLANKSAHAFPSGFPGRMAVVSVVAFATNGDVIWRNFSNEPMVEDPQAVLNKVYVNADGKPVPAPFSKELKRDNRLKSDETRVLRYELPDAASTVEVKVIYRLLPPKLANFIKLPVDAIEREPRVIAKGRWSR